LTNHHTGETIRSGIMKQVTEENMPSYSEVEQHFDQEVRWYFSNYIGRAELLGRLGDNIIVFYLLRENFINTISCKFLQQYSEITKEKYNLSVNFQPSVLEIILLRMKEERNLILGGRRIKSLLETLVEKPLNSWLFQKFPGTDLLSEKTLRIGLDQDGSLMSEVDLQ